MPRAMSMRCNLSERLKREVAFRTTHFGSRFPLANGRFMRLGCQLLGISGGHVECHLYIRSTVRSIIRPITCADVLMTEARRVMPSAGGGSGGRDLKKIDNIVGKKENTLGRGRWNKAECLRTNVWFVNTVNGEKNCMETDVLYLLIKHRVGTPITDIKQHFPAP